MTRLPIGPHHIRCVDGRWLSILTPPRRWERHADEEDYTQEPPVRLRAVPDDPAVEESGMSRYWHSHNRREGIDALYAQVPVGIVRAFIRLHGGIDEIGADALAELKRAAALEQAGAPPEPAPAAEAPATDSPARPSRTQALMAAGTHDFLGRPLTAAQLALDYLTPQSSRRGAGSPRSRAPSFSGSPCGCKPPPRHAGAPCRGRVPDRQPALASGSPALCGAPAAQRGDRAAEAAGQGAREGAGRDRSGSLTDR